MLVKEDLQKLIEETEKVNMACKAIMLITYSEYTVEDLENALLERLEDIGYLQAFYLAFEMGSHDFREDVFYAMFNKALDGIEKAGNLTTKTQRIMDGIRPENRRATLGRIDSTGFGSVFGKRKQRIKQ